jgi:hypothetical protein
VDGGGSGDDVLATFVAGKLSYFIPMKTVQLWVCINGHCMSICNLALDSVKKVICI